MDAIDRGDPGWLKRLDHTADEGIAVRAGDLRALFERLAWGMFSILTDLERVEPREPTRVSVEAPDREALAVRWLSELNYLHAMRRVLFRRFDVRAASERRVEAEVWGEPIDPARHVVHTEIKAVTFHGLVVQCEGGIWTAQVLFDV